MFNKIGKYIQKILVFYTNMDRLVGIQQKAAFNSAALIELQIEQFIQQHLHGNIKYTAQKRLNKYEKQVFSQNGEDGIIAEIFRRIGSTNKFFIEFGVQDGLECNSTFLLLKGWKGGWIEANKSDFLSINKKFANVIKDRKLVVKNAFITAENIEVLFNEMDVPKDLDLLSIDIDMNDYWVWQAINNYKPRVVIIEYNSLIPPDIEWIVCYDKNNFWEGTSHFNASLKSLEILARNKNYSLVGCNFTGANAFFVRNDLLNNNFEEPFTAENHYEPPRHFLRRKMMINKDWGNFTT